MPCIVDGPEPISGKAGERFSSFASVRLENEGGRVAVSITFHLEILPRQRRETAASTEELQLFQAFTVIFNGIDDVQHLARTIRLSGSSVQIQCRPPLV